MEGLMKGMASMGLGRDEEDGSSREERSRSTWAEVVSGDNDGEDRRSGPAHRYRHNQHDNETYGRRNEEEWEDTGFRPPRLPQTAVDDDYKRDEQGVRHDSDPSYWNKTGNEQNKDGWETVGKKHQRRREKIHMDHWRGYRRPPMEQEFSQDVDIGSSIEPTEEELADLSKACSRLWELDLNRLVPGKDYQIDCAEGKKVYQKEDMAEGSLFLWLSDDIFRRPTYSRFCSLLDNYNPDQGCKEVVSTEERQEQAAFIEEISRTAPIKYLHKCLSSKGIVPESYQEFKKLMTSLWFDLHSRGGTSASSSAFEHVFVGEIKQQGEQVSGFHNWLQFYLEEANGRVDYQGYILPRRHGAVPDSETQLLTIQFEWNGVLKSVSSTFVGVSPEFEVALYTLCFYVGKEDNHVLVGPYTVNIKCYHLGGKIGSVFPVAEC